MNHPDAANSTGSIATPALTIDVQLDGPVLEALKAAGELAVEVQGLLDFLPPDVNPVVLARQLFAPLQAALDVTVEALAGVAHPPEPDPSGPHYADADADGAEPA